MKNISKLKVLIVDDEPTIRNLIAAVLHGMGISNLKFASNGLNAWETLEQSGSNFDMIICDWMMPEMDGLEFLKKVRADNYETCFVMLTSKKTKSDIVGAIEEGVDAYVAKPFTTNQLQDKINALVRKMTK